MFSISKRLFFSKVVRFVPGFLEPLFLRGGEQVGGDGGERLASFLVFSRAKLLILVLGEAVLSLGVFMPVAAARLNELMFATADAAADVAKGGKRGE